MNYLFATFFSESVFSSVIVYFPLTLIICTNLHWVTLASIILGSISLYAKNLGGGSNV